MITLYTGSDFRMVVDVLDSDENAKNLSGLSVFATLSALDGLELIDDTEADDSDPEADFAHGKVIVAFPSSATATANMLAAIGTIAEVQVHIELTSGEWITVGPHRVRIERGQRG